MKFYYKLFIATLSTFIISCDVMEGPFKVIGDSSICSSNDTVRKTLLEDYTGHDCINCPDAAAIVDELKDLYGHCLIPMAIHVGFFARPTPELTYDFRTPVGSEWDVEFGIDNQPISTSLPRGMVNRTGVSVDPPEHILGRDQWPTTVSQQILLPPDLFISIEGNYNISSREVSVDVSGHFMNAVANSTMLGVYLLEDGIIQPQKWQSPSGQIVIIEDYEHNHVLRASFNGVWGDTLVSGAAGPGTTFSKQYNLELDTSFVPENCSVVAFVYDVETKEILQAESAHFD